MKINKKITSILLITLSTVIIGCSNNEKNLKVEESNTIKIGLMPAVDTAPILIAEKNGYFEEEGIKVEIEIYNNAQNRQSALQSYQIDAAMTDFIALATNVDSGFDIKATTMTDGTFPVLSKAGAIEKKDIKVGVMEVSVINYLVDMWLSDKYNIEKVFITEIPARLAAISTGEVDMGLFPEPVASNGELQGLTKTLYGLEEEYSTDCLVFTGKSIEEKPNTIKAFHKAYNKAVEELNSNQDLAREILIEKIPNINPKVKDKIVIPTYKKASLPSDEYIENIIEWTEKTLNKGLSVDSKILLDNQFIK
ncbi:ABC transporter substrate-binding protein [Clostridium sp.]|uniref:ABC transporter substrate-binding protein n=1 Tax=Clostridium sp. TaxID=1506 RepID=UPI0026209E10|nr:ABC transporter substrate-binding protein [Clostridium sp.]